MARIEEFTMLTSSHEELRTDPIMIGQREAARVLGLSERTLSKLIADGDIPSIRLGGRRLFSVEALKAWVAAKTEMPASGTVQG